MDRKADKNVMLLTAVSSLHVGGGSNLSVIDLPIQREKHTNFPKIEASSLKGSMRHAFYHSLKEEIREDKTCSYFGTDGNIPEEDARASAISVSDAKLLFFPIRSAKGIFAYVTCPFALNRFFRDCKLMDINYNARLDNLLGENFKGPFVSDQTLVLNSNTVLLEEYTFEVEVKKELKEWAEWFVKSLSEDTIAKSDIASKMIVISDDDFTDFVDLSTEVITRIAINEETGIAKDGALFNEEYLPSESILYSLIWTEDMRPSQNEKPVVTGEAIMERLLENLPSYFHIGANTTIGKGLVAWSKIGGK